MLLPPAAFADRLLAWYGRSRRDLPWRVPLDSPADARPDPYLVLVSEAMLQQTQVATVIPYFRRWVEQFPTVQSLAAADEQAVLRAWQGLGYYSRARNLRRAAQIIVETHGGRVPADVQTLLTLPGVGRYTAGAVASLAYDTAAPILDGNVVRVLCRVDRIETDPRTPAVQKRLWARAEAILPPGRPGDFNSAMMELGATVCIPRSPQCLICPVAEACESRAAGVQEQIPPAKRAAPTPLVERSVYVLSRPRPGGELEYLIEQRPPTGRWAGMWQFLTLDDSAPPPIGSLTELGEVRHALTHRRYRFRVFRGEASKVDLKSNQRWSTAAELDQHPMPKPHLTIARML